MGNDQHPPADNNIVVDINKRAGPACRDKQHNNDVRANEHPAQCPDRRLRDSLD